ncbi:MAG: DUF5663 domain-containing protein [Candidatus Saccharimonas sp.]
MPLLTKTILQDLGLTLSDEDFASLSAHFESTLDERVINEIVLGLEPEQAQQLSEMQQSSDEAILNWIKINVPDFAEIVSDEVDILLGELAENSETI